MLLDSSNPQQTLLQAVATAAHAQPENLGALAWGAGFIDGEACILISKTHQPGRKNVSYRLVVSINQNHRGSLERLANLVKAPTHIRPVKRDKNDKANRDVYVLTFNDRAAYLALETFLPYLVRKAPEARVALRAYTEGKFNLHPGPRGHDADTWKIRERAYRKLQRMK